MPEILDVVLVGIGGYGSNYVRTMAELETAGLARVCAVVDPMAENGSIRGEPAEREIPFFDTYERFLETGMRPGLAAIASPIAFHAEQSCAALAGGADVLCEKPLCATMQQAYAMIDARDAARRKLSIGYQWSFSRTIQRLKKDILAGRLGAPLDLRTWVSAPRGSKYYRRNKWAGRLRDSSGRWVFDSPVNNAVAHSLHNMLYLTGPATDRSATPLAITAECYRANPIENFDAACCRIETRENVPIMFFCAHCAETNSAPVARFVFEKAVVECDGNNMFTARFNDGSEVNYGSPNQDDNMRKLKLCVDWALKGTEQPTLCGVEAAMMHTLCVNGMQEMSVHDFDPALIRCVNRPENDTLTFVAGIYEAMRRGFEQGALFSELELPWASPAQRVELDKFIR